MAVHYPIKTIHLQRQTLAAVQPQLHQSIQAYTKATNAAPEIHIANLQSYNRALAQDHIYRNLTRL